MLKTKIVKAGLASAALIAGIALAPLSSAALLNAGFESPDASAADIAGTDDWFTFNSNFTTSNNFMPGGGFVNPGAYEGTQVLKQFGNDAGAGQALAASEGETWQASVQAINWSGDEFQNLFLLQLAFLDGGGGVLSVEEIFADPFGGQAYNLLPQDGGEQSDWTQMVVSGVAPAGTASAQILLLHINTTGLGGSIFLDAAELSQVPLPAAAWLFGSALLGLAGAARRRKG